MPTPKSCKYQYQNVHLPFIMKDTLKTEIELLDKKLAVETAPLQRLSLIDKLASYYAFTDIEKAQKLLDEQYHLFEIVDYPDFKVNYFLNKAMVENQRYNYTDAETYYLEGLNLLEEVGAVSEQIEALIDYAGISINLESMENAEEALDKAKLLLNRFPDKKMLARITFREGFIQLHYNNFPNAIELLLKAQREILSFGTNLNLKDYYFLSLIYSGLGRIYEKNDDIEKAASAYEKVVEMCEAMNMRTRLAWHYINVGNSYMALERTTDAIPYFLKSVDSDDDHSQFARASAYGSLGYIYLILDKQKDALTFFDEADSLYREISNEDNYSFSVIEAWKGRAYVELGETAKGLNHFKKALEYSEQIEDYRQLMNIYGDLADFSSEIENYRDAYEYLKMHNLYAKKHEKQQDKKRQTELEMKYEAMEKKKEMDMLKLEATRLRLKALRAQMNPHFMYNALNSIQHFITSNNTQSAAKYLAKFALLMRQSLEYSEQDTISLEKEIEFLENYLYINQKLRFDNQLKYTINIDDEIEEDIIGLPAMIIQPYVENAIEHGFRSLKQGNLSLHFSLLDEYTILCKVEDNGIGRKKAKELTKNDPRFQNHRSRGTEITEKRLQILHQTKGTGILVDTIDLFDVKTNTPTGTRVEIRIPIVEN